MWAFDCAGAQFVVRGGPDGPNSVRFDLARSVAANIASFLVEANEYLGAFVVPDRFQAFGPWEMEGVEFGREQTDPPDVFEVQLFLGDDIYGLWGVTFGFAGSPSDRFYPRQFRRRQH